MTGIVYWRRFPLVDITLAQLGRRRLIDSLLLPPDTADKQAPILSIDLSVYYKLIYLCVYVCIYLYVKGELLRERQRQRGWLGWVGIGGTYRWEWIESGWHSFIGGRSLEREKDMT